LNYIVATPIGNLKDISLRGLEILQQVDYILCEDTRRGKKLKSHFGLKPRLVSFHEHNERIRIPKVLSLIAKGKTFALISDAGMPLVSDPGYLLVQEWIRHDIPFTCVPGANAVTTALVLSGFPPQPFFFQGFLSSREGERRKALEKIRELQSQTIVLFESPERIVGLLREIVECIGDREVAVCRELTKLHEEVLRGKASEILDRLVSRNIRGEFTVVIAPEKAAIAAVSDETVRQRFAQLQQEGLNRKDALKKLAKETGRSRNDLYDLLMK
jgi:16S rRNA (cytidine1402-2'-O)-methyltransferase